MSQKYTIKTLANKGMLIALFGIDIFLVRKSKKYTLNRHINVTIIFLMFFFFLKKNIM